MTSGDLKGKSPRELYTCLVGCMQEGGIENAAGEVRFILEFLTGKPYPAFISDDKGAVDTELAEKALSICKRRTQGEPLQYLLGEWDFYGMTFKVGKGVLIPRADTETLVEEAVRLRRGYDSTRFADLCSGSGCIAAALARNIRNASGAAIEKSPDAMVYLRENLAALAPEAVPCLEDALLPETAEKYTDLDLITANPPYLTGRDMEELQREVTYEPGLALFGGEDGLMFYRQLTRVWKGSLRSGGWLLFETGLGQYRDVMDILAQNGFQDISFACDLAGIERVVMGRKP